MRFPLSAALVTLLIVALQATRLPAQDDGWKQIKGDLVPELKVRSWLNTKDDFVPTVGKLKGRVWVLAFLSTTLETNLEKVEQLSAWHEKYFEKGFRTLVISSEDFVTLKKKLIQEKKAKFWIGSDMANETFKTFLKKLDKFVLPKFFLIDVEGRVVSDKLATDAQIQKLLTRVFFLELDHVLEAKLQKAQIAYERGAYGTAWKEASGYLEHKDEHLQKDARYLRDKIGSYAAFRKKAMLEDLGLLPKGEQYGRLLLLREEFAHMQLAAWARQQMKPLKVSEEIKVHKIAWNKVEAALKRELGKPGSSHHRRLAAKAYRQVKAKYPDTVPAYIAEMRLGKLAEDG